MTVTVSQAPKSTPYKHPISTSAVTASNNEIDLHHSITSQYERRENHRPNLPEEEQEHYVLTLQTDDAHQQAMSALRATWFPSHLLKVDAHVTLFHALPGSKLQELRHDIASVASYTSPFELATTREGVYDMGKGVGIRVTSHGQKKAARIRADLRGRWASFLSQQDSHEKWRAHYTIMNKENDRERIDKCLVYLQSGHGDSRGIVEGLKLWRYDRGWWREAETFQFQHPKHP